MFNNPRPAQRYGGNMGASNSFGSSYVDDNGPLTTSLYDGLDPWSSAPSPSPPPMASGSSSVFASIGEATVPGTYSKALNAVDPLGLGDISVNTLSRVISTSGLPAATIDRIVNLVSSKPRVSKFEFFVALALVALAQSGRDISVEQVAALAEQNDLPEPSLDLSSMPPSFSDISYPRQDANTMANHVPGYSADDPWLTTTQSPPASKDPQGAGFPDAFGDAPQPTNGTYSAGVAGTGLPSGWWRTLETVSVNIKGQQGFILNRYTVYAITSTRGAQLPRRYSEFVILWEILVRRYPFRLLPSLPPKRIQPDEHFLEQRRKGLSRFLGFVANHPIIREDHVLMAFLSEPSFEDWRRRTSFTVEEESTNKRIDRNEEMAIPADLDDKLAQVRGKVNILIDHWQKICVFAERMAKRRESAAADLARMSNTMLALVEANAKCWRGELCELCNGVNLGIRKTASHCQQYSDLLEQRTQKMMYDTLEALKSQRDLYMALRELFIRYDKQSGDQVDKLRKKAEASALKMEGVRAAKRDGWEQEADRLGNTIEKDQATITALLHRRVFIRACMWHEIRSVLHNRENALVTQAVRVFAMEESQFAEAVAGNWNSLVGAVEEMPYE